VTGARSADSPAVNAPPCHRILPEFGAEECPKPLDHLAWCYRPAAPFAAHLFARDGGDWTVEGGGVESGGDPNGALGHLGAVGGAQAAADATSVVDFDGHSAGRRPFRDGAGRANPCACPAAGARPGVDGWPPEPFQGFVVGVCWERSGAEESPEGESSVGGPAGLGSLTDRDGTWVRRRWQLAGGQEGELRPLEAGAGVPKRGDGCDGLPRCGAIARAAQLAAVCDEDSASAQRGGSEEKPRRDRTGAGDFDHGPTRQGRPPPAGEGDRGSRQVGRELLDLRFEGSEAEGEQFGSSGGQTLTHRPQDVQRAGSSTTAPSGPSARA
jgi:hypothetical protein